MPTIFIDADACPVKDEVARVASRYSLPVVIVSNQGMRPMRLGNVKNIIVDAEFDAADNYIAEHITSDDIAVTSDILLAGRCLEKGGKALSPAGQLFTAQNIGSAKAMRELNAHLRETGEISGHNKSFSPKDRSQFLQSLDALIQKTLQK
jgi:uncharacterized protein YaiI (UPF0178 family)